MDYNDGSWYGWNGGECPVHPKSIIQVQLKCESRSITESQGEGCNLTAGGWTWYPDTTRHDSIIAFRVITPYVEPKKPREFWVHYEDCAVFTWCEDDDGSFKEGGYIHVREVIE